MDRKDIDKFMEEFIAYGNAFVAGRENSKILKFYDAGLKSNRGHAICTMLKMPEGSNPDTSMGGMGPAFYVEELMDEFSGSSIPLIVEMVNRRADEVYDDFCGIATMKGITAMTLDQFSPSQLILTAMPIPHIPYWKMRGPKCTQFIIKQDRDLCLNMMVKGEVYKNGRNQSYFVPISTGGNDVPQSAWDTALRNSWRNALLHTAREAEILWKIEDRKGFFDYFYLLKPAESLACVMDKTRAGRILMVPTSPYSCNAIPLTDSLLAAASGNSEAVKLWVDAVSKMAGMAYGGLPLFMYDADNGSIKPALEAGPARIQPPEYDKSLMDDYVPAPENTGRHQ